jgi:hypothetical protein
MFDPIQKLLPKAAAQYNFSQQLQAIKICEEYRRIARKILPPEAAGQAFPKSYSRNTLTIGVLNSVLAHQVAIQKHLIMEEINGKYGMNTVKNLKIEMTEKLPDSFEKS